MTLPLLWLMSCEHRWTQSLRQAVVCISAEFISVQFFFSSSIGPAPLRQGLFCQSGSYVSSYNMWNLLQIHHEQWVLAGSKPRLFELLRFMNYLSLWPNLAQNFTDKIVFYKSIQSMRKPKSLEGWGSCLKPIKTGNTAGVFKMLLGQGRWP